jgi:hypothetical protein
VEGTAIGLKWPNDILLGDRKLGGILVELLPGSPHAAVIGIAEPVPAGRHTRRIACHGGSLAEGIVLNTRSPPCSRTAGCPKSWRAGSAA